MPRCVSASPDTSWTGKGCHGKKETGTSFYIYGYTLKTKYKNLIIIIIIIIIFSLLTKKQPPK
jgi:hypothetical protein